jgi:peptide/nickel transport system substrate-binding protein
MRSGAERCSSVDGEGRGAVRKAPWAVGLALTLAAGMFTVGSLGRAASAATSPQVRATNSGGNITFGLEAETTDYCLSRARLTPSGIEVATAIYEELTVPNDKGIAVPYLAQSVTPNTNFTQWTIDLRPGITFQDGEPFNADAVKLNLDSYRGAPGAPNAGTLFPIVLQFISDIAVVDPMTVRVTLNTPVADFPAYLSSGDRVGMMAPAQINAGDDCSSKLIGTGPFKLQTHPQNEKTVVVRNPSYWRAGYPKADSITFVPVPDGSTRDVRLEGGQLDIIQQRNAVQIDDLRKLGGQIKVVTQPPGYREIDSFLLISGKAPFNSQDARTAFAEAVDRDELNQLRNKGLFDLAHSLMDRSAPGYVKNAGYPAFDLQKAQALVRKVKAAHGGQFNITIGTDTDPNEIGEAQLLKEQLGRVGINAAIAEFDPAALISTALTRGFDVLLWRNTYGSYRDFNDADTYPWFANTDLGNRTNLSGYNDPRTQQLLDQGRGASTVATVKSIYEQFNRVMAKRGYLLPIWYVNWTIAYQSAVKLTLPPLPDGHGHARTIDGIVPTIGLRKTQGA